MGFLVGGVEDNAASRGKGSSVERVTPRRPAEAWERAERSGARLALGPTKEVLGFTKDLLGITRNY